MGPENRGMSLDTSQKAENMPVPEDKKRPVKLDRALDTKPDPTEPEVPSKNKDGRIFNWTEREEKNKKPAGSGRRSLDSGEELRLDEYLASEGGRDYQRWQADQKKPKIDTKQNAKKFETPEDLKKAS